MSADYSPGLRRHADQDRALTYDQPAEGFRYDPASQVTTILHQLTASSTQINKADYLYNGVGNRTSLTDRRGSQTFGYDNLDRLTSASHPMLATPQSFAYDPVGNRTTGGTVVNAGNQLTADTNHTYQYDDNGNLIRKTLLATGNYTQYTYDAENRLTKVEDFVVGNPTAAFMITYRYDGLGRRIEKVANGQTKRYIYDGEDIQLEYDGSNVLQARYTVPSACPPSGFVPRSADFPCQRVSCPCVNEIILSFADRLFVASTCLAARGASADRQQAHSTGHSQFTPLCSALFSSPSSNVLSTHRFPPRLQLAFGPADGRAGGRGCTTAVCW
jgi:YD repeat-containing protein